MSGRLEIACLCFPEPTLKNVEDILIRYITDMLGSATKNGKVHSQCLTGDVEIEGFKMTPKALLPKLTTVKR